MFVLNSLTNKLFIVVTTTFSKMKTSVKGVQTTASSEKQQNTKQTLEKQKPLSGCVSTSDRLKP